MSSVQAPRPIHTAAAAGTRGERTARLLQLAASSPEPARSRIQAEVVELNLVVARSIAHRYRGRGEPLDDLEQVAALGLVKAVRQFDPSHGKDFLSYAVPTVSGEVKRHFRDHSWMVRPPRRIQELQPRIEAATDLLRSQLNSSPTVVDVAEYLAEDSETIVEALTCDGCFTAASLDGALTTASDDHGTSLLGVIGQDDDGYALCEFRTDLEPALDVLSPRDRHILARRVNDGWTQQEIADELGMSQMQVSRVLSKIRSLLRDALHVAVA
jgi:RNA polymerase sigma-B factor